MAAQTIISAAALAAFAVPLARGLRAYVADHRAYQQRLERACRPAVVAESGVAWRAWLDGLLAEAGVRIVREDTSWQDTEAPGWPVRSGACYQAFGPLIPQSAHTGWRVWLWRLVCGGWRIPTRAEADYRAWQREMWVLAQRDAAQAAWTVRETMPSMCPLLLDVDVERAKRIQRWAAAHRGLNASRRRGSETSRQGVNG